MNLHIPPTPDDESERMEALRKLGVLDSEVDPLLDAVAELAAMICETPMGVVTIVADNRQWFKASEGLDVTGTTRDEAFCAHAILEPERAMVIPDAADDLVFSDHPLVTGDFGLRFYAGIPLSPTGQPIGTLCVIDTKPRDLSEEHLDALRVLARIAEGILLLQSPASALPVPEPTS